VSLCCGNCSKDVRRIVGFLNVKIMNLKMNLKAQVFGGIDNELRY
jgi:hypothetical protein